MSKIIEVSNLSKSFGDVHAVNDISFYVERGKLFAFLGPNGAGKTTTIDMICTFLEPDSGAVTVDGFVLGREDTDIRNIIGAVFQIGVLDDLLSIEDNLKSRGSFYGLKGQALKDRVIDVAETAGVTEILKRPYGKLSGGQQRRCDIARALLGSPKIIFLDEPTTGLDPATRRFMWEMINGLREQGNVTIFLTTHYMQEAESADFVTIIDEGTIVAQGTPSELKETYSTDRLIIASRDILSATSLLAEKGYEGKIVADTLELQIPSTLDAIPLLADLQPHISSFEVIKGTMDDVFISITGKEIRND